MVKMLKVARRPILSDTAAQPKRPTRLPEIEIISWTPREGVIEWPLNGQFHDARDVIMMFWTDIFEVEDVDDDDIQALGNVF